MLDRLRRTLARMPVVFENGVRIPVTCSIGVARIVAGRSVHEAMAAADRALYVAKNGGRNRVEVAKPRRAGARGDRGAAASDKKGRCGTEVCL